MALPGTEPAARRWVHHKGAAALSDGIALGHVVLHEPRVVVNQLHRRRYSERDEASRTGDRDTARQSQRTLEHGDVVEGGEHREVLEAYRMFAHDRGWVHKLEEAVATGLTAEAAVERVQSDTRARMLRQTDPYLRERLHDLDDLANRLMRQLTGRDHAPSRESLPDNAIFGGPLHGPGGTARLRPHEAARVVMEEGGPTSMSRSSHARSASAAATDRRTRSACADPGDAIIVDGSTGDLHVRPTARPGGGVRRNSPSAGPPSGAIRGAARPAVR